MLNERKHPSLKIDTNTEEIMLMTKTNRHIHNDVYEKSVLDTYADLLSFVGIMFTYEFFTGINAFGL
jgi:hypothetical protein